MDGFNVYGFAAVLIPAVIAFIYIKMIKPWLGKNKTKKKEPQLDIVKILEDIIKEDVTVMSRGHYCFLLSTDMYFLLVSEYEKQMHVHEIEPMTFNGIPVTHHPHLDTRTVVLIDTKNCV